jgi:hypothetical protein
VTVGVVACGALALHVSAIARRRGLDVDVHPLPPQLHNRPDRIAPAVVAKLAELRGTHERVAVAYADCGSYGALDAVLAGTGIERLAGDTCYDLFARDEVREALAEEPGTYFLTDFLARTFEHTVWRSLGLDRHPELRDDYFHSYRRCIWLAQRPTASLRRAAEHASALLGLPLSERTVGESGLERELVRICTPMEAA